MFCTLEYIELPRFEESSEPVLQQILTYLSTDGLRQENKTMLFNPNCPVQILLEYLCSETGLDRDIDFDLCESSSGELINIKQLHQWSYATNVLKVRQSYVLILFQKDEFGNRIMIPLLNQQSKQYADILLQFRRKKGSSRRRPFVKRCRRVYSASKVLETPTRR